MKKNRILATVALLVLFLTSCGTSREKTRKPNENFSRGLLLVDNASSNAAFTVEPAGDLIQFIIPYQNEGQKIIFQYLQMNAAGVIEISKDLDIQVNSFAINLQMISDGNRVHIFWAGRENPKDTWQLWYLAIDQMGTAISNPQQVSTAIQGVSLYEVESTITGGALIIWEDIASGNILLSQISNQGELTLDSQLLVKEGEHASITIDSKGNYHLIWMLGEDIFYASFDQIDQLPLVGKKLSNIHLSLGNSMDGPMLGITNERIFVFWSILRQTGLKAGTAVTEYLAFPMENPVDIKRDNLTVFPETEETNEFYQGDFSLNRLVRPPTEEYYSTDFVYAPQPLPSENQGLAVAVVANQQQRLDSYIQIIVAIFEGGIYQGYTLATKTDQISGDPIIKTDQTGNLHLTWRDGIDGKRIYYSTTSPQGKSTIDRIGRTDIPELLLEGGLEAITGVLLFPFAFPWMAVGFVLLVIWRLVRNDEDVNLMASKILLAIALISYQISKLLFLPDILIYVPFSAWIDIPAGMGSFLKIAVPLLFFGIGFAVTEWRRRKGTSPPSALGYYSIVVLVDTVLTLAVYGVIFLGEY